LKFALVSLCWLWWCEEMWYNLDLIRSKESTR